MSSPVPTQHQRRFHVGRKSTAFDIVPAPLLVVEHIDGIAAGTVEQATSEGAKVVEPTHRKGTPTSGVRAFEVAHGGVYRVLGVEHRPVAVEKFVRYDEQLGFVEVDEQAFKQQPAPEAGIDSDLPALQGTTGQVTWAIQVRTQMLSAVRAAGRDDLLPAFRRRKFASFYIQLAHTSERWLSALEEVLHSKPKTP